MMVLRIFETIPIARFGLIEFGLMAAELIGLNDDWYGRKNRDSIKKSLDPFNSPREKLSLLTASCTKKPA